MEVLTGIYALVFYGYDPFYIGQSVNINKRFSEHLYAIKRKDINEKVLYAYENYGLPELFIIEECVVEELDSKELYYINKFNTVETGLNMWQGSIEVLRGELHPNSITSNAQLIQVITMLADTNYISFKDISSAVGVSVNIVQNISCGKTGAHMKDTVPLLYAKMVQNKGTRMSAARAGTAKKYPNIVSVDGTVYSNIVNISKFAKDNDLNEAHLHGVLSGRRKSHKGWKLEGGVSSR